MESNQVYILLATICVQFVFRSNGAVVTTRDHSSEYSFIDGSIYHGCNDTIHVIQASEGVITSPGYPAPYPHGVKCIYQIIGDADHKLRLQYTFMALDSNQCHDSVTIYGSSEGPSELLSQHCQLHTPAEEIVDGGSMVYVVFESDKMHTSLGFVLTFQSVSNSTKTTHWTTIKPFTYHTDGACSSSQFYDVTQSSGIIESPHYLDNYPAETNCKWKITAPAGQNIKLRIKTLNINKGSPCVHGYLRIYDEIHINETLCGTLTGVSIYSQTPTLYLRFYSDNSIEGGDFLIEYETVPLCRNPMIIRRSSGMLGTPGYLFNGHGLSFDTECSWKFIADSDQIVNLTIQRIDIDDGAETCIHDPTGPLHMHDGSSASDKVLKDLCGAGHNDISVQSTGRYMYMMFSSSAHGFEFTWTFVSIYKRPVSCRSAEYLKLKSTSGTITSPNYPLDYPNNEHCKWEIVGNTHQHIIIRILALDMELPNMENECSLDYLQISKRTSDTYYPYSDEETIATYCGLFVGSQNLYLSSSQAYIDFKSDDDNSNKGFAIDYEKIDLCQNPKVINKTSGRLGTPGYIWDGSGKYPENLHCTWLFKAGPNQVIVLSLHQVDIEESLISTYCYSDVLKIYNGASAYSLLIKQICTTGLVDLQFKSTGDSMYMIFTTDEWGHANGFEFSWEFKDREDTDKFIISHSDGCNGGIFRLTGDSGRIMTPKTSSGKYPAGVTCRYSVTVDINTAATLAFSTFALEDDPLCVHDWVKVYDGTSSLGTLLGTYCGTQVPSAITSTSHTFYIEFHSDSTISDTGFIAAFGTKNQVDLNVCGITHMNPARPADTKVVGGEESVANSHPWMALVLVQDGEDLFQCGGSIIADQWILTAAHCTAKYLANEFTVVLGIHDLSAGDELHQVIYSVTHIYEHPNHNSETFDNDIALLKLNQSVTYSVGRRKVCLPENDVIVRSTCWIAGWGVSEGTADNKYRLNQAKVEIISTSTCNAPGWLDDVVTVTENMFCAGFAEGGLDTCQGDSGGPLVCEDNGFYTQYGIVSFGARCAEKKKPGVYTRLYNYIDWIHQHIERDEQFINN